MDATAFFSAVNELAESKGISKEAVIESLKDSLQKAYIKYLGGGDDAVVTVTIDEEKGDISVAQIKKVVDEVQDDYLEVSVEDANAGLKKAKYKAGDDFAIPCSVDEFSKMAAMAVRNLLRQNLATAERTALYDIYKDHIGEMVTGTVEKADDRSVSVNIGRTTVELGRREMIGDEYFKVGDPIKVYIQEVKSAVPEEGKAPRGPQIEVTRSSEGFLKRLFEEEIHEIYDGTVIIKGIAREAGIRSKVAVMAFPSEKEAKEIAEKRALAKQAQAFAGNSGVSANDFYAAVAAGTNNDVNVVIKADTDGSAQALKASLEKLSTDKVHVKVLLAQAGAISDSDVLLASASHALIYGFNVRPDARVRQKAEEEHVEIHLHQIIYELLDEMKAALQGKVKVEKVEAVTGQAEIRHLYKISKVGTVAGSYVTSGVLKSGEKIRLLRSGVIAYSGQLGSLKRFKDDVKEVKEGYECGLTIENFNDLKEGDVVEGYELVEKK